MRAPRIEGAQAPVIETRPFKVIIFDVDNTLIYRSPRPTTTLLAFAHEKGLPTHPDALQRGERRSYAFYADGQADEERVLLGKEVLRRNYVTTVLESMCVRVDVARWLNEALARLTETSHTEDCPDHIRQVVRMLFEAGYRLAAVSNRDGDLRPLFAKHGLSEYFLFTLSGGRAGVYKPNPEIFRIVLRTLGVAPAATLAIGDSYDADIVGAQAVGINVVLLDSLGVFPDVRCRTIRRLDELIPWLIHTDSDREG